MVVKAIFVALALFCASPIIYGVVEYERDSIEVAHECKQFHNKFAHMVCEQSIRGK